MRRHFRSYDFKYEVLSCSSSPHHYFVLYRIKNDTVYIDNIFHELQDFENKMN